MREPMETATLTISRLARQCGVNLETVRYYEREDLLPRPPRTPAGYRMFPREAARRLRFIRRAQELGFSLKEIRELLSLRMKPGAKRADMRARAQRKIADIEQKIRTLEAMKKSLRTLTERCDGCGTLVDCPIVESLDEGSSE
jgi:MerR family copper efflux transcriptional regulator